MNYGSGKYPPFGETLSTVGVWRYPKQMTWPSAVATTTLPLAIAGDESTRARVVNVQSGLPHPDYRARRAALSRVTADVADRV